MLIKEIDFWDICPAYEHQKDLFRAFFSGKYNRYVLCWHRRAGKDYTFFSLAWLMASLERGNYLYTLPKISQSKNIILEGTTLSGEKWIDTIPPHLISSINLSDRKIYFTNGSILNITGADSILSSHLGANIRGIFMSEYQRTHPQVYDYLRPIINRNPKGFFCINFTAFGKNHAYHLLKANENNPNWYCQTLTVDDTKDNDGNPIFSKEQIEEERRSGADSDILKQEYYCDFTAIVKGTFFSEEMQKARNEGRICKDLEVYPGIPVHTSWDLGVRDQNSVWFFQVIGTGESRQFRYFYEHSATYKDIPYYIELLNKVQKEYGFSSYSNHFLPHDSLHTEWSSGKTRRVLLLEQGLRITPVPMLKVIERIQIARNNLKNCWFKEDTCKYGIMSLEASRAKYDESLKAFSSQELHDWASHASSAFCYGHVGWLDSYNKPQLAKQREYARLRPLSR